MLKAYYTTDPKRGHGFDNAAHPREVPFKSFKISSHQTLLQGSISRAYLELKSQQNGSPNSIKKKKTHTRFLLHGFLLVEFVVMESVIKHVQAVNEHSTLSTLNLNPTAA